MNKFKLILLGGIISILSISISSAYSVECTVNDCIGDGGYIKQGYRNWYCFDYGDTVGSTVSLVSDFCQNILIGGPALDGSYSLSCDQYPLTDPLINKGGFCFRTSGSIPRGSVLKLDVEFKYPPTLPGEFNSLTPAIDGLRGIVYEIIPYIIYIGIGVLLAILGFYAIRWLVNWMWGKLKSYFISKKR